MITLLPSSDIYHLYVTINNYYYHRPSLVQILNNRFTIYMMHNIYKFQTIRFGRYFLIRILVDYIWQIPPLPNQLLMLQSSPQNKKKFLPVTQDFYLSTSNSNSNNSFRTPRWGCQSWWEFSNIYHNYARRTSLKQKAKQ